MRDMIRRLFHAASASTAFFLAAMSMWLVLTTRGITTESGIFLLMIAAAGLFGGVVHGLLAYAEHSEPLSIRPDDLVRSFHGLTHREADQAVSHHA